MAGTIRERGPGRWQIQVYVDGRRYAKTIRGTRRDAQRALPEFIVASRARSDRPLDDGATFGELLDRWLTVKANQWKPSTARNARYKIDRHVRPALGPIPLTKVKAHHLDALYAELLDQGLSARSVIGIHALIQGALTQAIRWDLIATNPAQKATPPSPTRPSYTTPTYDQISQVVASLEHDPAFAAFLRLAAATGARRGTLVVVQWRDFDLEVGAVTFARSVSVGTNGPVVMEGSKTGRVYPVSLDAETVARLRTWRARQIEHALACGAQLAPDAFVFATDPLGREPWLPGRVTLRWRRLRAAHGLDRVRFHDVRHAAATHMLANGVDVNTVAERLGNDPATTLRVYGHSIPAKDRAAADLLGRLLDAEES